MPVPGPCTPAGRVSVAQHGKLLLKHGALAVGLQDSFSTDALKGTTPEPQAFHILESLVDNTEQQATHLGAHTDDPIAKQELLSEALIKLNPPFCHADFASLAALLRSCGNARALPQGQLLHGHIIKCELGHNVFLGNLLLQMYGKCGAVDDAHMWFAKMPQHDQYSWNFMASAYTRNAEWNLALVLYDQLRVEGMVVEEYIISSILSACAGQEALVQGKRIHACIVGSECESDEAVENALVNLYGRCECFKDAWRVFDKMSQRSVISWSAMITAYSQHNHGKEALCLWNRMQQEGVAPNRATVLIILDACASQAALAKGKQVHGCLLGSPFDSDGMVLTALVNMYGKCGDMEFALKIFEEMPEQNVVSWTTLMAAYAQHGHSKEALQLFEQMQREGVAPNKITFVSILDAYASKEVLDKAKQIHARIKHSGFDSDVVVATAILNMYGKCGSPSDAQRMFDEMPERNVVSWNAMISAYAQHGHGKQALELFDLMLQKGLNPDKVTFISMFSACASQGALSEGKWMHDEVVRRGHHTDVVVGNAIINLYSKCGNVELAQNVFERISGRNVVSWSSMIAAYAQHGHGKEVLPMLQRMKREGVLPNQVIFKIILSACSHAGLVDDAHRCLDSMSKVYGVKPAGEHYDCVVDLFGRAGRLDEVEEFIAKMPVQPSLISWMMFLGACSRQADLQRGERAAHHVFEMYPECSAPYVILSNMYVAAGRDSDAERVIARMKCKGLMKQQDSSYIEVNGKVNEFLSEDGSHPQAEDIYLQLQKLNRLIEDAGFDLMSKQAFNDLDEESKDHGACCHTERLAIACGYMSTHPGTTLFIAKSVRMCSSCHLFSKLISKIGYRKIIINDACRFHRMQDGSCSCSDHW